MRGSASFFVHLDRYNRSIESLHRQKWKSSDRGALLTPGLCYLLATYATSSTPYWLREKVFGCCWHSHWDRPVTSIYRTRPGSLIRETHQIASEPDLPIPGQSGLFPVGRVLGCVCWARRIFHRASTAIRNFHPESSPFYSRSQSDNSLLKQTRT